MRAAISAICPTRIGAKNETSSIDAVTASVLQWRCATMAAAMSIQWSTLPPRTFPIVFASFGKTSSTISTRVSRGLLPPCLNERGVHVLQDLVRLGLRTLLRELDGFFDLPLNPLEGRLLVRLVDDPALHENLFEPGHGIALLPILELFLGPVVGGIDLRMSVPPVGLHLDQRRALSAACAPDRFLRRLVGREEVVPVDRDAGEAVGLRALGDILDGNPERRRDRFGPEIVLHHEHAVQLVDAREVQGLVPDAVRCGALTHEADRHVVLLLDLVGKRAPGRDHGLGRDRRRRGDDPEGLPSVVAGVRLPAIRAVLAREELRHDVLERHSLRDGGAQLTMLNPNRIFRPETVAGAHDGGLLAHGAEIRAVKPALLEKLAAPLVGCADKS